MKLTLPTDSTERKNYPIASGCDDYFPAALAGVARHSFLAGARHTPGEPMHHKRGVSGDHRDCIRRHHIDIGDMLAALERGHPDGGFFPFDEYQRRVAELLTEADAQAWRSLALSQELHERYGGAPLAPAARLLEPKPQADLPFPLLQGYPNPRCAICRADPCTCVKS